MRPKYTKADSYAIDFQFVNDRVRQCKGWNLSHKISAYFKKNFDMDLDMVDVMDERAILCSEATKGESSINC